VAAIGPICASRTRPGRTCPRRPRTWAPSGHTARARSGPPGWPATSPARAAAFSTGRVPAAGAAASTAPCPKPDTPAWSPPCCGTARWGGCSAGAQAPSTLGDVPAVVHPEERPATGGGAPGIPSRACPGSAAAAWARMWWRLPGIDSQQKRVFGYRKQGAAFGYAKIGGKSLLVRGLNVLAATISTPLAAPVIAAARLRGGNAASARGVVPLSPRRLAPPRCGCTGRLVVRMASAYHSSAAVWAVCRAGAYSSVTAQLNAPGRRSPRSATPPGRRSPIPGHCGMTSWAAGSPTPKSPRSNTPPSPHARAAASATRRFPSPPG
jgi:hypothetical protein